MNQAVTKSVFSSSISRIISCKPGFLSLSEVSQKQNEIISQCASYEGELVLIESNYLIRPYRGVMSLGNWAVEETRYLLGVIDTSTADNVIRPHVFIPISKYCHWKRGGHAVAQLIMAGPLYLEAYQAGMSFNGTVFHRISIGNDAVTAFLEELSPDIIYGGERSLLHFWKASQSTGVDISGWDVVKNALIVERKKAVSAYVQKKIEDAARKQNVSVDGMYFGPLIDDSTFESLLWLGLSKEEIRAQAREMVLSRLFL